MRLKLFGILGALLVLAACESTPWDAASSSGMGAVAGAQGYGNGMGGPGGVGSSALGAGGAGGMGGAGGAMNGRTNVPGGPGSHGGPLVPFRHLADLVVTGRSASARRSVRHAAALRSAALSVARPAPPG